MSDEASQNETVIPLAESDVWPLEDLIRAYMVRVVGATNGNKRKAARLLEISPSTLYAWLKVAPEQPRT